MIALGLRLGISFESPVIVHPAHRGRKEDPIDPFYALAGISLALVFVAGALAREIRLRRALQELLRRLLNHWRIPNHEKNRL